MAARQSEVAAKGSTVMPFDLDKTTHRFTPRPDGLLQEVVADEPADTTKRSGKFPQIFHSSRLRSIR
ncbi:hypothetical protein ALI22I_31040 [Saccharothrix sp. ALI-22-I]|nr:hypothetical protein ALI22I_31040 [Saccharothrix sp. ALI-22-I]